MTNAFQFRRCVLLAALLGVAAVSKASVWQCDDGIVEPGDLAYHVSARCGEPFWVDSWLEQRVFGPDQPIELRETSRIEEWFFNLGPNRLIRKLTFRDGKLLDIDELGYGVARGGSRKNCRPNDFKTGMTTGEIILQCGPPEWRDRHFGSRTIRNTGLTEYSTLINFQTWLYDFGRNRFVRVLRFENSVLTDVDVGERGLLR